jgi:hypothetical protein
MPDISMCNNSECPSKECCFRFTAEPSEFCQSYTNFTLESDEVSCSFFMPNGKCKSCGLNGGNHKMSCYFNKAKKGL